MKKTRKIILGLVFILLFTSMGVFAEEISPGESIEDNIEDVKKEASKYGTSDGNSQGKKDFEKNLRSDWKRDIKDDDEILDLVKDKSKEHKEAYLEAYKKAYEEAYLGAYSGSEKEEKEEKASTLEGLGADLGTIHGEISGFKDYKSKRRSDWEWSIPSTRNLEDMFDLRKLPSFDRDSFLDEFREKFQLGYEDAYYNGQFGTKRDSMDGGRTDGSEIGELLGKTFGIKDYHEGRSLDYNRNMPSESKIRIDYSLNSDNKEYTDGFINGFINAYQVSYASSFREAKKNVILLEDSSSYENGKEVGEMQGRIQGSMDHMERKTNNWQRSKPLASSIAFEYNLNYQSNKYRDGFISGFWDGYAAAYNEVYKDLSQTDSMAKTSSETIPIAGGVLQSLDSSFIVEIESGIYYKPIIMTIDSLSENYSIDKRYISASNFYRLNVVNPSRAYGKNKKINIAFEYYGDKDGGIYQLENGKWTYLTSTIEDGFIVASVNPSTISSNGNIFAVLVDTETEVFHDIRGHWAKDEITAYIRRGVINGYHDNSFKPNQNITRAEFLILLSRLYEWYMPYDTSNNEFFRDFETFNPYNEKHISYSLSNEYIIGYPDQHFRPYNNISYKEVDIIMKRVLKDSLFKWEKYAEQMIYDKKVRSSSYDSYDNKITRAEFSYMLYKLNEWKY